MKTIRKMLVLLGFFEAFFRLQDKNIVSKNQILLTVAVKQTRKTHQSLDFLPISKTHTNALDIFGQYTCILYIFCRWPSCGSRDMVTATINHG